MADLVACLSYGKGTWGHVIDLINTGEFDDIYLIGNEYAKENFSGPDTVHLHVVDHDDDIEDIRDEIQTYLDGEVASAQVGVNIFSGSGKEHMALLSACLRLGLGMRFVVSDGDEIRTI